MDIPLWMVVVERKIHLGVESLHTLEVVYIKVMVLGSNWAEIGVALCMVYLAHKVVGMVDMDYDHIEVFDCRGLVSMVVQSYIEEGVHRHMVVVVGSHEEVHHSHRIDMHLGMALAHSMLEEVVAKKVVHKFEAPPTFNCPNLDACSHYSFHSLHHNLNQTHSQRGENS